MGTLGLTVLRQRMEQATALAFVLAAYLFDHTDAHGFHHPSSVEQDPSFENIVEQRYSTLPFMSKHRRQLAEDFTHESGNQTIAICDPKCYWNEGDNQWLSCDDLVCCVDGKCDANKWGGLVIFLLAYRVIAVDLFLS